MAKHTGKSIKQIQADLERDNFMSGQEAIDYGLIDTLLERRSEIGSPIDEESE